MTDARDGTGRTLLLGLGSSIRRDDGVGPVVARRLADRLARPDVVCEEACFGGMRLLDLLEGYERAVVIDALRDETLEPGALVPVEPGERSTSNVSGSHGFGLLEALGMARGLELALPARVSVYGIAARDLDAFGEGLSPQLSARVEAIVEEIARREFAEPGGAAPAALATPSV